MLHWKITSRGAEGTHVLLYGEITESTGFGELKLLRGRVVFDMAGIRRINSFGVREMLNFLETLGRACQIEAERCSTTVVNQLNMLPEFSRKLRVRSIIAPMECGKCGHEADVKVDLPVGGRRAVVPLLECDTCQSPMTMAEPEDRYFAFLTEA